ncbi:cell division protein ZapA [Oceanidesulfovibrio marinus]|uniref:Cell division protein ZapA n=2 Tax=Oceanidesulfovibrio marinus TaxID=370038 RepID=A0A6P1ZLE6_9BACT|nr:cell division protein ZapA [Oceanidesulfovibrio marinus]TVM36130.1 cell division protein ZapA [Oceanidesulfovibrio marinus]
MNRYNLTLLGFNISFMAEADRERVDEAVALLESRYKKLDDGRQISRERLLIFLALGLADDLLLSNRRQAELEERLGKLVARIEEV